LQQLLAAFGDPGLQQAMGAKSPVGATVDSAGGMDYDRAVRTIANDFDKVKDGKGTLSLDKLKTIAKSGPEAGFSPELKAAAQFMVDNSDDFKRLETADQKKSGGLKKGDGKIGLTDLTAELPNVKGGKGDKQLWDDVMSNSNALFNGDKTFSFSEVQKIAEQGVYPDGTKATPQQQQAAQQLWSRKDLLMGADSADKKHQGGQLGDQLISKKDVEIMQKQATAGAERKDISTPLERMFNPKLWG
jgi:hypothetical protein